MLENEYREQTPKVKNGSKAKTIAITAICCSIIGACAGTGAGFAGYKYFVEDKSVQTQTDNGEQQDTAVKTMQTDKKQSNTVVNTLNNSSGKLMTASEVYENSVESTVGITTSIKTNYFGYTTMAAASGSGFIISDDGYIVTNYHVIDGANSVKVTLYSGESYDAEITGTDMSNDIAVLKIDAEGLAPVTLGSSDELKVGDDVAAIGNPLGELTFSLTSGVVSALDREITTENATMNLIQTDCAINSGNSGGALFNMYGEVVGITNAKYSSNSSGEASIDNIGFAIPIDSVKEIINSIIDKGYAIKPYIGVTVSDVSDEAAAYGLPEGAAVAEVSEDSPAEKAGIKANDIITSVNGEEIKSASELTAAVKKTSAGDELTLGVYRQGEKLEIKVTVDETKSESQTDNKDTDRDEQQESEELPESFKDFEKFFGGF